MKNYPQKTITCPHCQSFLILSFGSASCPKCQKKYLIKNKILILNESADLKENQIKTAQTSPFLYSVAHCLSYDYVFKYLSLKPCDNLLDIGCGLGHFLKLATKYTTNIIGIDNDFSALCFAAQTTDAALILTSAETLPFADNSFDKITMILVLEHIENDLKVIKEIKRVAKNNATLVLEIPALEGKKINSRLHNLMHHSGTQKHFRQGYLLSQIKNLLSKEGLIIKKKQFTFVYFTELFIEITKYFYWRKNKKYDSQIDILQATENSSLFKIYKFFFPLLLFLAKLEDKLLSPFLKGHALILKIKIIKN